MKVLIIVVLGLLLLIVGALFSGANDTLMTLDYLIGDIQLPLSYLLISAFILGMLLMVVLFSKYYLKTATTIRRLQKLNRKLQKEVHAVDNNQQQKDQQKME